MRMPDSVVAFLSELAEKRSSFLEVERPRPESVALFCLHSCNHPLESGVSSPRWTHLRRTLHPNPIQIEIITNESREMISLVELISTELQDVEADAALLHSAGVFIATLDDTINERQTSRRVSRRADSIALDSIALDRGKLSTRWVTLGSTLLGHFHPHPAQCARSMVVVARLLIGPKTC